MAVSLSALSSGDPRVLMCLGGLGQLKDPMTSSKIETATFRLEA
jgi:hypothetical protein